MKRETRPLSRSKPHPLSPKNRLEFPTFIGHKFKVINSPGRLELFGTERTKSAVRPCALTSLQQVQD